jgi:hypothetical protein
MKAIKGDVLNLWIVLENFKPSVPNAQFSYFVVKNKRAIKDEVDSLNEAQEPSEAFKEYDQKRAELAMKFADKDSKGNPITQANQYKIEAEKDKFDKELIKLKKKYAKALEEREEQAKTFSKLLSEEIEFDGYQIDLGMLPPDTDVVTMEILFNTGLIKD